MKKKLWIFPSHFTWEKKQNKETEKKFHKRLAKLVKIKKEKELLASATKK